MGRYLVVEITCKVYLSWDKNVTNCYKADRLTSGIVEDPLLVSM
jgi:hypothetical protein